ncbi:heme ABC transporter ATP-binding protein [Natrarchaeobius halalkaliphilus]|uniref:Cobalamin import ATP-binding protein BtuD n=1 Tax=Natrarchaeobius halalkaliphilus TaxID=1679091 RepID=A0A3N6LLE2_9EURY|nr:heme ABC transporter ATP-binding protein [Natrarchaeobius halalkaliphilus]RQG89783.1 heme ABC transporter ATP-binding protein [Natrarchaeobius halalkaliphilus]
MTEDRRLQRNERRLHQPTPIGIEDVGITFGELSVLEDVSLSVDPGEFVGFVGPNGAGKTSLLRAISGAIAPSSGTITIDDTDVHAVSSRTTSRLVAVVPQDTSLSFSFPVRDVVEMGRHPHRSRFSTPTADDRAAVERALERTRTAELAARSIDEVSGGQRQRVVLARAIAQETPVLLLDEPTASLDINHQVETLELVRELVEEDRTVVAAIHDLDLAARYCDRLVLLANGSLHSTGPPSEVLTTETLAEAFDANATVTPNPVTGTTTVTTLPHGATRATDGDRSGEGERTDGGRWGRPHVHIVGSGPAAAGALTRLERAGLEVSVGPVPAGDVAAETAGGLGVDRIEIDPLSTISSRQLAAFDERVRTADATVIADLVVGPTDESRRLLESLEDADPVIVLERRASEELTTGDGAVARRYEGCRDRAHSVAPESLLGTVRDRLGSGSDSVPE